MSVQCRIEVITGGIQSMTSHWVHAYWYNHYESNYTSQLTPVKAFNWTRMTIRSSLGHVTWRASRCTETKTNSGRVQATSKFVGRTLVANGHYENPDISMQINSWLFVEIATRGWQAFNLQNNTCSIRIRQSSSQSEDLIYQRDWYSSRRYADVSLCSINYEQHQHQDVRTDYIHGLDVITFNCFYKVCLYMYSDINIYGTIQFKSVILYGIVLTIAIDMILIIFIEFFCILSVSNTLINTLKPQQHLIIEYFENHFRENHFCEKVILLQ